MKLTLDWLKKQNACEDGNYFSYGNYDSYGNYFSYGNYDSYGNSFSYGNYCSKGNYKSKGNYDSYGNYKSKGNAYSFFLQDCKGTYNSIFCKDQKGISNMVFNQQVTEDKANEIRKNTFELLKGWLPYPTNYLAMAHKGWHKEYKETNEYVKLIPNYTYQRAWKSCPVKQELIDYIKTIDGIDTEKALKVFTEITGIEETTCCGVKFDCNYCPHCGKKLKAGRSER